MASFLIGITGGSGSGKTTFIEKIKSSFTKQEICIISLDNYYKPIEEQTLDARGIENFDLPEAIDDDKLYQHLQRLRKGEQFSIKEYTFNNPKADARTIEYYPAPIIVVEGLFVFHYKQIQEMLDLKIYIHAKENLKVIRRIRRDRVERNYPLDDVLYRYEHHVLPAFEKYVRPYIDDADIIINNNAHFDMGLEVMLGFLKTWLEK